MAEQAGGSGGTRAVERALALLSHVCEVGEVTLTDAARAVGLSPATALRLLRTLEAEGYVLRGESGYRPGARSIQIGAQAMAHHALVAVADDVLDDLLDQVNENLYLGMESGDSILYVAGRLGRRPVGLESWLGRTIPRVGTAAGEVFDRRVGADRVAVVRGGADVESTSISAPILVADQVIASLSVVVPHHRATDEAIADISGRLLVAVQQIAARLGG